MHKIQSYFNFKFLNRLFIQEETCGRALFCVDSSNLNSKIFPTKKFESCIDLTDHLPGDVDPAGVEETDDGLDNSRVQLGGG